MTPTMEEFRETAERLNRVEALANALRYNYSGDKTADDVLKSAQKYFEFLQGTNLKEEDDIPF